MTGLKLSKLPDRTPVKVAITISPELHRALTAYAALYQESYGDSASITDLIPPMLVQFLAGDRAFVKANRVALEGRQ